MLSEQAINYIAEAKGESDSVSSNTKGVLHEILVGKHLLGKHMEKHPDVNGDSPKEAHDKLKATISPHAYAKIDKKAKSAAEDIKKRVGSPIHDVHWTSKPGDLHRSTGIHASQKEDASDIVVHTKKGSKVTHHGVSLKITDKKSGEVPVSNPGMESTHGGQALLDKYRTETLAQHPKLKKVWDTNSRTRKDFLKANPKMGASIKQKNGEFLNKLVDHVHGKLKEMEKSDSKGLANHVRKVIAANPTPMQSAGHNHIRHTTYGEDKHTFSAVDPSKQHEHILKDHKNITVDKSGTSVIFKHKDAAFAKHRFKFENQGDPKSAVKGSGELVGSHGMVKEDAPANSMGAAGINGAPAATVGGIAGPTGPAKGLGSLLRRKTLLSFHQMRSKLKSNEKS